MATDITTKPAPPAVADPPPPRKRELSAGEQVKKFLAPLASLRLTCVLFVLALILVFCGTLAQVDWGIWTVVNKYFRSYFVWIPFQIFFPRSMQIGGGFPF